MNVINPTKMQADYVLGLQADGRETVIVVVKGTYTIPKPGQEARLADEQAPLVYADVFNGDPGFSAMRYEYDFASFKPRCDVLLNGSAYAPGGRAVRRLTVSLEVEGLKKRFNVVGQREWKRGWIRACPSRPQPYTVMPISYDNAYGGVDNLHKNPKKHVTYLPNFAGKGFYPRSARRKIVGKPLPNTEEVWHSVKHPGGKYRPMALGALGRAWIPRRGFAGTYGAKWVENTFPFLPNDFDPRYNQAAPEDQQIDYLVGGEEVRLLNLTPEGRTIFRIPKIEMPIVFSRKDGEDIEMRGTNDTLLIEPDLNRFTLVWRAVLPLKKSIFELEQVMTGRMPDAWYRARLSDKIYYSSIHEYLVEKQRQREDIDDDGGSDIAVEEFLDVDSLLDPEPASI